MMLWWQWCDRSGQQQLCSGCCGLHEALNLHGMPVQASSAQHVRLQGCRAAVICADQAGAHLNTLAGSRVFERGRVAVNALLS